jgi:hypothetical protein
MFLFRLDKEIYKNVKLDFKNLGKVNKNGPKHVLNTPMRQGNFFIQCIVAMIYIYIVVLIISFN